MLPISPISAYIRSKNFVLEEWETVYHSGTFVAKDNQCIPVLRGNEALIDPKDSFNYFASPDFGRRLQDGESKAYYLFFSAILAGYQ
jgi:endo-1,3(4)-beta-glucanase